MEVGYVELYAGVYYRCGCGELVPEDVLARDGHLWCQDTHLGYYEDYEMQAVDTQPEEDSEDEPF